MLKEKSTKLENTTRNIADENLVLEFKIMDAEKLAYTNMLVIPGVPEPKGENVMVSAQLVASAIGFKLDVSIVDS